MEKDVKPYKQNGMTCAIVCMLMALEYYKIIPKANYLYEQKYYRIYRSKYMDGTPFAALAWHLSKNNLDVEIFHSEKKLFKNNGNFSNEIFDNLIKEYKSFLDYSKEKGAKLNNGIDINCDILKEKLNENNLIILAGQIGEYLHAILLCGYDDNNFIVCDPMYKRKQVKSFKEVEEFMNTNIGKWFIAVKSNNQM